MLVTCVHRQLPSVGIYTNTHAHLALHTRRFKRLGTRKILPGTQTTNCTYGYQPFRPIPADTLEQMRKRGFWILLVVRENGRQDCGNAEIREKDDSQRGDDRYWDRSLRIFRFLPGSGDAIETDESVKARCCSGYNTGYTIRRESAGSVITLFISARRLRFPIGYVSLIPNVHIMYTNRVTCMCKHV